MLINETLLTKTLKSFYSIICEKFNSLSSEVDKKINQKAEDVSTSLTSSLTASLTTSLTTSIKNDCSTLIATELEKALQGLSLKFENGVVYITANEEKVGSGIEFVGVVEEEGNN